MKNKYKYWLEEAAAFIGIVLFIIGVFLAIVMFIPENWRAG